MRGVPDAFVVDLADDLLCGERHGQMTAVRRVVQRHPRSDLAMGVGDQAALAHEVAESGAAFVEKETEVAGEGGRLEQQPQSVGWQGAPAEHPRDGMARGRPSLVDPGYQLQ